MLPVAPKSSGKAAILLLFSRGSGSHPESSGELGDFRQYRGGIGGDGAANRYEFDDIDPPLSILVFCDERLRF